jgi:hypothetical protein
MFAIGITGLDLNNGPRYFDVIMQGKDQNVTQKTTTPINLIPCEREVWANLGFGDTFDKLNLTQWLCADPNITLELQGKFTSNNFLYYKFGV